MVYLKKINIRKNGSVIFREGCIENKKLFFILPSLWWGRQRGVMSGVIKKFQKTSPSQDVAKPQVKEAKYRFIPLEDVTERDEEELEFMRKQFGLESIPEEE